MQVRGNLNLEERKQIEKLSKMGMTYEMIAKAIGRGKNTAHSEIKRNGGRANYNAEKAQAFADQKKQIGDEKRIKRLKGRTPTSWRSLRTQVESLEIQLNILQETLKDLLYAKNN